MPRGRQYYDPIIQVPSKMEGAPVRRIELYPEHDIRDNVDSPRWVARLVGDEGEIVQHSPGSFDHDGALRQAQQMWPGLEVFELREESEDSTHEGMGPSPRLWQNVQESPRPTLPLGDSADHTPAVEENDATILRLAEAIQDSPVGARQIRVIIASDPGAYTHIDDIILVLEDYAIQYDEQGNPSGAVALREAAAALKEPF